MPVVTKSDLVHAAARAGNLSKSAAGEAVNAVFDAIVTSVAKGNRVTVVGFGTFLPRKRKARAGRSRPRQGDQDQREDGARVRRGPGLQGRRRGPVTELL